MNQIVEFTKHLIESPWLSALAALALVLFAHFLYQFVIRGWWLRVELKRLSREVRQRSKSSHGQIKASLAQIFSRSRLQFAWSEFEETLHEQYVWDNGERRIADIRATLPAEAFFNTDTAVDPWLGAEYFKHLPGILTGLGIIGTFTGLITGLIEFNPSASDPDGLRTSLGGLFHEVRFAFTFSALAIGSSILITSAEKWIYSSCAKWVVELAQALDGLFRAGVGEEYLSSLVQASHENATQTRQLKESLVEDLKSLLTNLTERQVQATHQLSTEIGQHMERAMHGPLEKLADTVRATSGSHTEKAGAVLENLMASFMAQMRETLGGQVGDLTALLQQSAQSMSQVELTMRSLVADLQRAGQESTNGMQSAMRQLLQELVEHQQGQSRAVTASTQVVMDKLQGAIQRIADAQEESNRRTSASMESVSGALQARVDGLANVTAATMTATQEAIGQFRSVSTETIDKLSSGANTLAATVGGLQQAADRMGRLAEQLTSLQTKAIGSAETVAQATTNLGTASQALSGSINQLVGTTGRLEGVSNTIALEADARAALLRDMKDVIARTQEASVEFGRLQQQVESTLSASIEKFGSGVGRVISSHLTDYQKQLGDAVSMLQGALEELAEYASEKA